jgi:hypothetical protein
LIKKVKIKDSKKFLKLFNNKDAEEIWKKICQDFSNYEWDEAEFHFDSHFKMSILFKNFRKKDMPRFRNL